MNKVSCITVTRDRVPHLKKCVDYFIKQTHAEKELVIVYYNTDKTTEQYLLDNQEFLNENNVFFHKFVEDEGLYLGAVRNYAVTKATGDWICIWDDDDYYSEKRIERQLQFCIDEKVEACTLRSILIYSNKYQELKLSFERYEGWEGSLMVKRIHMPRYKNLPKGEDTPAIIQLMDNGIFKTYFDPELYVYIFHDDNISGGRHKEDLWDNSLVLNMRKNREFKKKLDWI